jgi:DNA-binding response OmpR family regulator
MCKSVLIVDDTPVIREFLKEFFDDAGFDTDTAENGQDGLKMALKKNYSLILSDVHMPVMSGMDLVVGLRSSKPDIPIIMMDSLPSKLARLAAESGAQGCLSKPFDLDELRTMVERLIGTGKILSK